MTEDSFKDKERYVSHQARYPRSMDEDYVPRKEYDLLRQKLLEAAKEETEKKAKELKNKKTSFRTGFLAGVGATTFAISVIAALFYQSCQGNGGNSRTSHNDAGTSDAGAAPDASYDQTDHSGCYPPRRKELEELQKKLVTCETDRDSYKSKLEACLQENEELSKRPRYCTAPKVCPPVNECPQLPYIRKGD